MKAFSPSLHRQFDDIAKSAGMFHAYSLGSRWVQANPDKYGCDVIYKLNGQEHLLETEVKLTWPGGPFPYDTINVLGRKAKYFIQGASILILARNLQDYLIIDPATILAISTTSVDNKYMAAEEFYQVPIELATFYKFSAPLRGGL